MTHHTPDHPDRIHVARITRQQLGLPDTYDPDRDARYIPTHNSLRQASIRALDNWTAFMMVHADAPETVVAYLDRIADAVRAACGVPGEHLAKAVKLGLALEYRFWAHGNRLDDWCGLIMALIGAAIELGDSALQSEVYRAWSICLYMAHKTANSMAALEKALEYAEECGSDRLRMLAHVERHGIRAAALSLDDAEREAQLLVAAADRLRFNYAKGRVYLTLAQRYQGVGLHRQAFAAAQQGLICCSDPEVQGMQAFAGTLMLGNLQLARNPSAPYRAKLLDFLSRLAARCVNPFRHAATAHLQANEAYQQGDVEGARRWALEAWLQYRHAPEKAENCARVRHLLGIIETRRNRPAVATRHLKAAGEGYRRHGEDLYAIHIEHALAWIPFTAGDFVRARELLDRALEMVGSLSEAAARGPLYDLLLADRDEIDERIRSNGSNGHAAH